MTRTILVADDEPAIVDLLDDVLAAEGYRVLRARDGREALAALVRERPNLLITDHQMPHLTGLDLITHLRAQPPPVMPVILISSAPSVPPPPSVAYLPKPFDFECLLALVDELLAQVE